VKCTVFNPDFFCVDRWRPKELRIWFMWKTLIEYRRRQKSCLLLMKVSNQPQNLSCHVEKGGKFQIPCPCSLKKCWHITAFHIFGMVAFLLCKFCSTLVEPWPSFSLMSAHTFCALLLWLCSFLSVHCWCLLFWLTGCHPLTVYCLQLLCVIYIL
jgi:hypothetical protein